MPLRGIAAFALLLAPAQAHHSIGPYDYTHSATISGVVTAFAWINPHAYIFVDVKQDNAAQRWKVEIESPNALRRSGWTKDSLKPGDTVTCIGARAKDPASQTMRGWIVILPDGRQLSAQADPFLKESK
ncbi:MAG TPA: DUF6152 family protein [Bryobacteraceae bacterium]|jgi:hypothetical protein